ncbi:MAG: ion channel, partial [Candidatus Neomarinimicrobiota bacterium]
MGIRQTLARHPLLRVFGAILLVAMIGGLGVLALERRAGTQEFGSIPEALWWAIVTMTTVGYGDYVPKGFTGRILAVAIMFAGISLMAVLSGTVASRLVARRLRANLGLHPIEVKDHIIVCGWHHKMESLLNALLTVEYEDKDYEVVLINEEQEDRMQSLKHEHGYTRLKYIRGDFAREATLKKAELEFARAVIILPTELPTGQVSDEKTILATLTIKNLNPKIQVVAYVHDWSSITPARRAKADEVVLVDNFGSFILASHILNRGTKRLPARRFAEGHFAVDR